MKRTYVEVSCNYCDQADHYRPPSVDMQAKTNGWIVVGRKHFCDSICQDYYNQSVLPALDPQDALLTG